MYDVQTYPLCPGKYLFRVRNKSLILGTSCQCFLFCDSVLALRIIVTCRGQQEEVEMTEMTQIANGYRDSIHKQTGRRACVFHDVCLRANFNRSKRPSAFSEVKRSTIF